MSVLNAAFSSKQILEKLSRLGITNKFELLLHLPLRYEDETHIYPINDAPGGKAVQVEGQIIHNEVLSQPRRQLVFQVADGSGILFVRLFNFYGSQRKTYAAGKRVRLLGEIRQGFYGVEMIHPKCRIVREGDPLAETLTPVYPTTVGLSQKTIRGLLGQLLDDYENKELFADTLPDSILAHYQLAGFKDSMMLLHKPPPCVPADSLQTRTHPAWRRIKFDELLAQQLSMRLHYRQRRNRNAPELMAKNKLT